MDRLRLCVPVMIACLYGVGSPAAAQTGPVAAYGFNELSGGTVSDASGNGNTGTITGATWAAAGKFGGGLSFNGSSNLVTIPQSSFLNLTTGMTLEAWVRPSALSTWRTVLLKESSSGLSYAMYVSDTSSHPSGFIRRTSDISATGTTALPLNAWTHLAATYDGSALRLFVNGVQTASRATTGSIVTSSSPLRIGGNSVWGEYFSGVIDEVRVYNRALSASEIQTDMATPVGGTLPPSGNLAISGTISPSSLGGGSTVTLAGPTNGSATAASDGTFSFSNLGNGTYTITPTKTGLAFTPSSRSVVLSGTSVSGVDFSASSPPPPPPGIRLVQKAVNGSEASVNTMSATFPAANTAGNFLIVTGTAARPAGTLTISDSQGNTYLPALGPINDGPQDVTAYIWYVPMCKGGSNTVTITPTSARALEIHLSEWSGLATASPVDQATYRSGLGTLATSGPATTVTNGELVFGYTFIENNASAGAGFTQISLVNGDVDEYAIQPTAGPVEATFTQTSGDWFVLMTTFKPRVIDTTPPDVSISAPAGGTTVGTTVAVTAAASDDVGVAGVQFRLDGNNLGTEITLPPYNLSWDTTTTVDGPHSLTAVVRDAAGNVRTSAPVNVTVSNSTNPQVVGQWSSPFDVGIVAVNSVLLHTGKVLMFSGSYETSNTERVWDPVTGAITVVANPYYNLFCAGQAQLPDGRILVAGGYDPSSLGAANANIFDPVALSWSALPNMSFRRWYPTVTGLPDGRMLVMSGGTTCLTCLVDTPEIFDPATNRFTQLTSARYSVPYYPFMYVLPDGRVLDAGANESAFETQALDLKTGSWSMIDPVVKDGHSSVMFRPGKILKTGTAADSDTIGTAARTAYVLDTTQPNPVWQSTDSMAYARAFQNMTMLPDGNVLVTGGGTTLDGHDITKGVLFAETWSPATGHWQTLSKAAYARLYHSTALLLPDGRVLIAGSGNDYGADVDNRQAEIYSPPYLFKGARPAIGSAPDLIQYGAPFSVQSADAGSIASVALIRPGAVTHAFDEDQRYVPLTFSASGTTLTVTAPANSNIAPPGYYMLFIVNSTGVPSVATWVHFPAPSVDAEPPTSPADLSAQGTMGAAALSWTGSTDNTGVSVYNVHRSIVSGFVPTAANRVAQVTGTSYTNTSIPPGVYFYVVTAQDIAGNVSGPSNEAGVTVFADTTPPTVSITSPTDHSTVSGSITIGSTASDDVGIVGVQFKLDGANLGSEKLVAPYSVPWNTATVANGSHIIAAAARDAAGNTTSASVTVDVANLTPPPPTGLVLALGFNEGTATAATDTSGSRNNGSLVNGAAWSTAGHTGGAISFSANGWINVPDAASLDLTTGMTLEAWVRPTSGTGWRTVVLKEASSALSYALYSANSASRPGAWVHATSAEAFVLGTSAVPTNAWTHLAATYDGTTVKFFVNGVQVASKAGVGAIAPSAGALRIGGNGVWGEYFRGLIDDVRIYNRPLTATEIQTDMNTGIQ